MNNINKTDQNDIIKMLKALGNPVRFEIFRFLLNHPGCITGDIVDILPIAQSTTSQHLKVLKDAGLIQGEIEGTAKKYCLNKRNLEWLKLYINKIL